MSVRSPVLARPVAPPLFNYTHHYAAAENAHRYLKQAKARVDGTRPLYKVTSPSTRAAL